MSVIQTSRLSSDLFSLCSQLQQFSPGDKLFSWKQAVNIYLAFKQWASQDRIIILEKQLPLKLCKTWTFETIKMSKEQRRASLVAQWWRVGLPVRKTQVQSLIWKIPHGAEQLSLCFTTVDPVIQRRGASAAPSLHM